MKNKQIVRRAGELVRGNRPFRQLAWIWCGVSLGLNFLLTVVTYLLDQGVAGTGGLAGIQNRAILMTAQLVLQVAVMALIPFWDMGFSYAALQVAGEQRVDKGCLTQGFHRWSSVLGTLILRIVFLTILTVACLYGATTLYTFSPMGMELMEQIDGVMLQMDPANPDLAALEALLPAFVPIYVLTGLAAIVLVVPAAYRLRLSDFAVMDDARGGMEALRRSARVVKGRFWKLVGLDLRFWWYYVLLILAAAVAYGDRILGLEGPVAYFGFVVVSLAAQLGLYILVIPRLQTAFALFYKEQKGQVV